MYKLRTIFFSIFSLTLILSVFAADPLETLIQSEKKEVADWSAKEDELRSLPPTILRGSVRDAEIFSPQTHGVEGSALCQSFQLDELVELSGESLNSQRVEVNISKQRVRDKLSEYCLVRPGDPFVAVGSESNNWVYANKFIIEKEPSRCADDSPYTLKVEFEPPANSTPLFFSTNTEFKEGGNKYSPLTSFSKFSVDENVLKKIEEVIPFVDDYQLEVYEVNFPNCDKLMTLVRRSVTLQDEHLPNEIIIFELNGKIQILTQENVETLKKSGHISLTAVMDVNQDGLVDLLIDGDHAECAYQNLFMGTAEGFKQEDFPNRPCSC